MLNSYLSAVFYRCMAGGKLPDAMDRVEISGDPFVPLSEIREVLAAYPRPLIDAIDHGLKVHPCHRPQSVTEWRRSMAAVLPSSQPRKNAGRPAPYAPPLPSVCSNNPPSNTSSHSSSPLGAPPDLLLWCAGGLLAIILLIVFILIVFILVSQ